MDIQMPIKDGFQATKEIRSFLTENNLNQIPIIATSAFGDQQYKDQAKKVGMTDYIEKIAIFVSDFGLSIPRPEDKDFEQFLNHYEKMI